MWAHLDAGKFESGRFANKLDRCCGHSVIDQAAVHQAHAFGCSSEVLAVFSPLGVGARWRACVVQSLCCRNTVE